MFFFAFLLTFPFAYIINKEIVFERDEKLMFIDVNIYKNLETDSDMIQAAVDAAALTGETVVIPKINARTGKSVWDITKTILLDDESTVVLQNAHLRLGDGAFCNAFANRNSKLGGAIGKEHTQRNISIIGIGSAILDGGMHNGMYEDNGIARKVMKKYDYHMTENCMMYFRNVENLKIDNITIKNQRYWGICMYTTSYSRVSNIRFISESNVPNQDGVDILNGCHDVIVENITGSIGDNIIAILASGGNVYRKVTNTLREGDIHNITVRNVIAYGVCGCALIRLLNHDGYRIYNVRIDNVIEASPWSENDASVAQNPDLVIKTDDEGNILPWKKLIPGEKGYRTEATIIIGESYWYAEEKAKMGDTFGISISNVMSHSRYGVWLNNTLLDSSFDNIRMFGNGFMAVYFGEGEFENVRFSNLSYDKECKPLKSDEHIYIDWNKTESKGFSCVYFNGSKVEKVLFDNMKCGKYMDSVFGGHGTGNVLYSGLDYSEIPKLTTVDGVKVEER